jgi:hypothetical protein
MKRRATVLSYVPFEAPFMATSIEAATPRGEITILLSLCVFATLSSSRNPKSLTACLTFLLDSIPPCNDPSEDGGEGVVVLKFAKGDEVPKGDKVVEGFVNGDDCVVVNGEGSCGVKGDDWVVKGADDGDAVKGEDDDGVAKGEGDCAVNGDGDAVKGEDDVGVVKGEGDCAVNGEDDCVVAKGEGDCSAAKGEFDWVVAKGEGDCGAVKGEDDCGVADDFSAPHIGGLNIGCDDGWKGDGCAGVDWKGDCVDSWGVNGDCVAGVNTEAARTDPGSVDEGVWTGRLVAGNEEGVALRISGLYSVYGIKTCTNKSKLNKQYNT